MKYFLIAILLKPFIVFSYLVFVAFISYLFGKLPEGKLKNILFKTY